MSADAGTWNLGRRNPGATGMARIVNVGPNRPTKNSVAVSVLESWPGIMVLFVYSGICDKAIGVGGVVLVLRNCR